MTRSDLMNVYFNGYVRTLSIIGPFYRKVFFCCFHIGNFVIGIYLEEERIIENLRNITNKLITLKLIIATKLTENLYTSSAEKNTLMIKS